MTEENREQYPCSECLAGVMHLRHITYFTWLYEELITVPNFPAWVCDVCGRREYDISALSWLSAILAPETGKAPASRRRLRPPAKKRPSAHPVRE